MFCLVQTPQPFWSETPSSVEIIRFVKYFSSGPQLKDAPKATKAFKILDPRLLINWEHKSYSCVNTGQYAIKGNIL
jgi:hypothetical protein